MKYSDDTEDHRKANIGYVMERWRQLYELQYECGTEEIKYLFLVNSGAAVAVLAFLGSVANARDMIWPKVMLGFFAMGIVLVGFLHVTRLYQVSNVFKAWRVSVNEYYTDQKGWSEITNADIARSAGFGWVLAHISFLCFIVGIIIGIFNFSTLTSGDNHGRKETNTTASTPETISTNTTNAVGTRREVEEKGRNADQPTTSTRPEKEVKPK